MEKQRMKQRLARTTPLPVADGRFEHLLTAFSSMFMCLSPILARRGCLASLQRFKGRDCHPKSEDHPRRSTANSFKAPFTHYKRRGTKTLNIETEEVPKQTDMKRWFSLFSELRNKTRGHGATLPGMAGGASVIRALVEQLSSVHLHPSYI